MCKQPNRGNLTYQLPAGPSPVPSPKGRGVITEIPLWGRMCASFYYLTGCLVGVTSHITPLPTGEGMGEGPAGLGETTMSTFFTCHTPLFSRGGRTGSKERLFYIQEQAFLEARRASPTSKKGVVLNAIRNILIL